MQQALEGDGIDRKTHAAISKWIITWPLLYASSIKGTKKTTEIRRAIPRIVVNPRRDNEESMR